MRVSSTAFLTLVAYQFAMAGSLPRISYLTLMDRLMLASFVLIAVTALQSVRVTLRRESDPEAAARIDRNSKRTFPLIYALVAIGIVIASAVMLRSARSVARNWNAGSFCICYDLWGDVAHLSIELLCVRTAA